MAAQYSNQKTITIGDLDLPQREDKRYSVMFIDDALSTMKDLNKTEYCLWWYFYMTATQTEQELEPTAICEKLGIGRRTYYTALKGLVRKGYLIPNEGVLEYHSQAVQEELQEQRDEKLFVLKQKNQPEKGSKNFFSVKNDVILAAIKNLEWGGFRLWLYLYTNKEGYTFGLGQKPVCNATGMGAKQYYDAVQELIEKRVLIGYNLHYTFNARIKEEQL